jgi:hypothetical protein
MSADLSGRGVALTVDAGALADLPGKIDAQSYRSGEGKRRELTDAIIACENERMVR